MKLKLSRDGGYALLLVMVLVAVSLLAFSSVARWTSSTTMVNDRNNAYNQAVAAAEGGTEKAISYMARDFFRQSFDPANARLYGSLVPTNNWAQAYEYSDGAGALNRVWVESGPKVSSTNLDSQFNGLYGMVYSCKVRANARLTSTYADMAGAVRQELQLAAIPVFQFAIFYSMDLEVNPGPVMKITGKVHSNGDIYSSPGASLEYMDAVTAVGNVYNSRMTNDPSPSSGIKPIYDVQPTHVSSLTLPIGTNNNPSDVHKILEPPPIGESPSSDMGSQRYYNQTDLIITTTAAGVSVKAGLWDGFADIKSDLPGTNGGYSFIKTDPTFLDTRENKWTQTTEIDVAALNTWIANATTNGGGALNNAAKGLMGHQLNSIYVDDQRTNASKLTVVRVTNGKTLPTDGLTVATQLPLYVQGNFNAPITTPGSTNTTSTKPASLVADAITVLSGNWVDANSNKGLTSRPATDTTVNAAFLSGIVQTTNTTAGVRHYSGGVENFPRFLEGWGGDTLTYNGSMVVMFPSQRATNFWVSPGTYYQAPTRSWAFDKNFLDYKKLPPATPQVRKVIRGQWTVIAANAPN